MADFGALQLVRSQIRDTLAKKEANEKKAEQNGGMTSSIHLISAIRKEIEEIFRQALAE
ncbi:MAG TPA: hypothetical protein VJC20_03950 [Candidatus Paceibacterota bacterium]